MPFDFANSILRFFSLKFLSVAFIAGDVFAQVTSLSHGLSEAPETRWDESIIVLRAKSSNSTNVVRMPRGTNVEALASSNNKLFALTRTTTSTDGKTERSWELYEFTTSFLKIESRRAVLLTKTSSSSFGTVSLGVPATTANSSLFVSALHEPVIYELPLPLPATVPAAGLLSLNDTARVRRHAPPSLPSGATIISLHVLDRYAHFIYGSSVYRWPLGANATRLASYGR